MTYESRLNAYRLNTTYLGLFIESPYVSVGGTDVTSSLELESFELELRSGAIGSRCAFVLRDTTVEPGDPVEVRNGGSGGTRLFSGHVLPRTVLMTTSSAKHSEKVVATDTWFLDRFATVNGHYSGAVGTIVSRILADFTDGGWTMGLLPSAVANTLLDLTFVREPVSRALDRIAADVGAIVVLSPWRSVSMLTALAGDGHASNINNSSTEFWDVRYEEDLSQARNRTTVVGAGTELTVGATSGDTTLNVKSGFHFDPGGGDAVIGGVTIAYTGRTETTLTGVTGLTVSADVGDLVSVAATANDTAAQTALATVLGGGASGVVAHEIRDARLGAAEVAELAASDVARFASAVPTLTYRTRSKFVAVLKYVTLSLTSPVSLSKTLQIETIHVSVRGTAQSGALRFEYAILCTPQRVAAPDLLRRIDLDRIEAT